MRTTTGAPDWRGWRALALIALLPVAGLIALGTMGPPGIAEVFTDLLVRIAHRLPGLLPSDGYDGVQTWANVAMFVPVGALLAMGLRPARWPVAVLAGPALSLTAETVQHVIPGRVPDVADLAANTAGSLIGFLAGGAVVGVVAAGAALARSGAQAAPGSMGP